MTVRALLVVAVALALGSGVVLAAGGQSAATAITDPTATPATARWRLDSIYLAEVAGRGIEGTEGELLSTARNVCRDLDLGRTRDEVVVDAEQRYQIPGPDAEYLVDAAVRARCPERAGTAR